MRKERKPGRLTAPLLTAVLLTALLALTCASLCACGSKGGDPFAGRTPSDLTGYDSMKDYDGEVRLVATDAAEVAKLMKRGETFAVFCGYEDCAYCNLLLPYLNEAAVETGCNVGYIDTRANPEWMNNNDIDDFDKFLDCFGEYLTTEENGEKHLYTPDTYFVKDGAVAARHEGVLEGVSDPERPLTEGQEEELRAQLAKEFESLK